MLILYPSFGGRSRFFLESPGFTFRKRENDMRLFNVDLHISVVGDLVGIFKEVGHRLDDISLSGHHAIMGKYERKIAGFDAKDMEMRTITGDWAEFHQRFAGPLSVFDGFVVTYPPPFVQAYEPFKKPVILQIP